MKKLLDLIFQISVLRRKLSLRVALDSLGKDASPDDIAPDKLGCAESVSTIMKKAGTMEYIEVSTYRMYDYLNASKNWSVVETPEPGDIIISPTGHSKLRPVPFVGHVGIVGKEDVVLANVSATGRFMASYTLESWRMRWAKLGGYPVLYYRYNFAL